VTKEHFKALILESASEMGKEIFFDLDELSLYAVQRAAHLSTITNEPGFDEAVRAERDAVALKAGISATNAADAADQRIIGVIHGALRIGALALI